MSSGSYTYKIFSPVMRDPSLSAEEKLAYAILFSRSKKRGIFGKPYCLTTTGRIASILFVPQERVCQIIQGLEKRGHVHIEVNSLGRWSRWKVWVNTGRLTDRDMGETSCGQTK